SSLDEGAKPGSDFLAALCRDWEAALAPAIDSDTRVAIARIGVVLGPGGGALQKMLPPFRLGIGGPLGNGRQVVSWIHLDDLVALLRWLLETEDQSGVFNATAPNPVTMKEWATCLGQVLHRPAFLPVPGFMLRLALGEVAEVLLTGQRVLPRRATENGFAFSFPGMRAALEDVLAAPAGR
ncbi:MAG: TIGR01777 family oxidoreductase, partial [Acidobacteriota bacterium]|nr:TIGR01777 family oxidoreductase [Acidobacteriota bacterium]